GRRRVAVLGRRRALATARRRAAHPPRRPPSGLRDRMAPVTVPSLWLETAGDDLTARPRLPGDAVADVAIIGAGYTGLWAAHHLLRHDPSLRVVVLEREIAGWGASGRNGGWCSALFPAP